MTELHTELVKLIYREAICEDVISRAALYTSEPHARHDARRVLRADAAGGRQAGRCGAGLSRGQVRMAIVVGRKAELWNVDDEIADMVTVFGYLAAGEKK